MTPGDSRREIALALLVALVCGRSVQIERELDRMARGGGVSIEYDLARNDQ